MDTSPAQALALSLAREALQVMAEVKASGFEIRHKSDAADPVTLADTRIEALARARILKRFPQHRIIGEENGETGTGDAVWYLDPVDGTMNYTRGLPFSSFTCAYAEKNTLQFGLVADPLSKEVFYASRGQGAWLGSQQLQLEDREDFEGSIVLLELENGCRPWQGMLTFMQFLAERQATARIMGSSALALAQVAAGRADLFLSGKLQPYDKAGGLMLIAEAGGDIGEGALEAGPVLAGAPSLVEAVRRYRQTNSA